MQPRIRRLECICHEFRSPGHEAGVGGLTEGGVRARSLLVGRYQNLYRSNGDRATNFITVHEFGRIYSSLGFSDNSALGE